jgi:uncharacterized membrane protein
LVAAQPEAVSDRGEVGAAVREKLLRWAFFGLVFAVLPIIFNAVSAVTRNQDISLYVLLSHGELLLVSAGIAAASGGELFGSEESRFRQTRLFLVGMSFLIVCAASLWFADIAAANRANEILNRGFVAIGQLAVFGSSAVTGGCSIIVSGLKQ